MNKSILISVRPEYAVNILNGKKTLELRKSVPKDFVGWAYMYVTKAKMYGNIFVRWSDDIIKQYKNTPKYEILGYETIGGDNTLLNGKVVARWWHEQYSEMHHVFEEDDYLQQYDVGVYYDYSDKFYDKLCLTKTEVNLYGNGKELYAWHIKKLEIFDKPMVICDLYGDFAYSDTDEYGKIHTPIHLPLPLTKAPQSWQYVWTKGE
jgi:hypothetical protein